VSARSRENENDCVEPRNRPPQKDLLPLDKEKNPEKQRKGIDIAMPVI
jgi:hypothetical protein